MKNIRFDFSYDGSNYNGLQVQPKTKTVMGEIEKVFLKIFGFVPLYVYAGRTDKGVSAYNQVMNFKIEEQKLIVPIPKLQIVFNSLLPNDIKIKCVSIEKDDFHSRFSSISREYRFYIKRDIEPFEYNYFLSLDRFVDINKLNEIARNFVRRDDFSSFSQNNKAITNKIREVHSAYFFYEKDYIVFHISASSFLWKMVRMILTTILELEKRNITNSEYIDNLFQKKDNQLGFKIVPSNGLFLYRVNY